MNFSILWTYVVYELVVCDNRKSQQHRSNQSLASDISHYTPNHFTPEQRRPYERLGEHNAQWLSGQQTCDPLANDDDDFASPRHEPHYYDMRNTQRHNGHLACGPAAEDDYVTQSPRQQEHYADIRNTSRYTVYAYAQRQSDISDGYEKPCC